MEKITQNSMEKTPEKTNLERNSFTFFRSFYDCVRGQKNEVKGEVFSAICEYVFYGKNADLTDISASLFTLIRPILDTSNKRYISGLTPKQKANPKQNRSKIEANPKQTSPRENPFSGVGDSVVPIGTPEEMDSGVPVGTPEQKQTATAVCKKAAAAAAINFDLGFVPPKHLAAWQEWLRWKQESSKPYTRQQSVEAAYTNAKTSAAASCKKFSDYINLAISNEWTYFIATGKPTGTAIAAAAEPAEAEEILPPEGEDIWEFGRDIVLPDGRETSLGRGEFLHGGKRYYIHNRQVRECPHLVMFARIYTNSTPVIAERTADGGNYRWQVAWGQDPSTEPQTLLTAAELAEAAAAYQRQFAPRQAV
jgi:hypothetical protein